MTLPGVPTLVRDLATQVTGHGGRAYLVGGCVRDHLLDLPVTDWDVEVHGIPEAELMQLLHRVGKVNAVGRAFGVYKVTRRQQTIDVSLPRKDSKVGPGHRGIQVRGDPFLSVEEASRRRDLTINAILMDPLSGEILDPHHGHSDLRAGRLRAVDPRTFLEDPLRALRVAQLAARLLFQPDRELVELGQRARLDELPAERIQAEWVKLLLRGAQPSVGLTYARQARILHRLFPDLADRLEPDRAVDRLARGLRDRLQPEGRRLAAMLGAWMHPLTPQQAETILDRLWIHRWKGYALRARLLASLEAWSSPLTRNEEDVALRHLSVRAEVELTLAIRFGVDGNQDTLDLLRRAYDLGIAHEPPEPLLKGRDLRKLGIPPGPAMGEVLQFVYAQQLDGAITDPPQAVEMAQQWWRQHPG